MKQTKRIYLSPPYQNGTEKELLSRVLQNNWLSTVGPELKLFEESIKSVIGQEVLAVNSGTSALHLILSRIGVSPGDEILVSDLTFVASINPIRYLGAEPILIDSERLTWNIDPDILEDVITNKIEEGKKPKAVIVVHLYGMPTQIEKIHAICKKYQITLIEDAAEALGSSYNGRALGAFGEYGFLSFNGNKTITTSGGGAVICSKEELDHFLKLATQSKDEALHYEHSELGYNYRLSNVLAALGLAQISDLDHRVNRKREIFGNYKKHLSDYMDFLEEPEGYFSSRWLSCGLFRVPVQIDALIKKLDQECNIECRPIWKPMHLQPLYKEATFFGSGVSVDLFKNGICLPSGVGLSPEDQEYVIDSFKRIIERL